MKIHSQIIQGTEEWFKIKWKKIGGSTSKGLLVDSDTLLINTLSEYLEPFQLEEEGFVSDDMLRGNELEPEARRQLENYTGIKFNEAGWIESLDIPIIGISPDGTSQDETVHCELKCPAKEKHTKTLLANDIPSDNIHQCIHYFTVNPKCEKVYFCSFRPESEHPIFVKMLTLDSMVNLGTEKTPKMNVVKEWVRIARYNARLLEINIQSALVKLNAI